MHLTRQHVLAAALLAGLGVAASLYCLGPAGAPASGAGGTAELGPSALLPSASAAQAAAATLAADLACDFEPLKAEVKALRERAGSLAAIARNFARRVGLHDANLGDPAAAITLPPTDPAALAKMRADVAQFDSAIAQWEISAGKRFDASYEDFMTDIEQRVPTLLVTTIPVEYQDAKKRDDELRAAGVAASDPRRQSAQANVQLYRGQLIRYSSGLNEREFEETRFVLVHAQDPAATLAEYQADKGQYLAAKAEADAAQQRYEAARLIPLPPQRTKNWRLPQAH